MKGDSFCYQLIMSHLVAFILRSFNSVFGFMVRNFSAMAL